MTPAETMRLLGSFVYRAAECTVEADDLDDLEGFGVWGLGFAQIL
jgi:hypothetical protein